VETEPSTSATGAETSAPSTAGAGAATTTGAGSEALALGVEGLTALAGAEAAEAGTATEAATGAVEEEEDLTIGVDCYTHMSNVFLSCFCAYFSSHDRAHVFVDESLFYITASYNHGNAFLAS
jgi:hypothetical protein